MNYPAHCHIPEEFNMVDSQQSIRFISNLKFPSIPFLMKRFSLLFTILVAFFPVMATQGFKPTLPATEENDFILAENSKPIPILIFEDEDKGILRAATNLADDFGRVTGNPAQIISTPSSSKAIIAGQIGSPFIEAIINKGLIQKEDLDGKYEKFILKTVANPLPGVDEALVIAGSDQRGTIYGIYELSRRIGVSPWYDWADVPVVKKENLFIPRGEFTDGEPTVKVRGIFLNDEFPCLGDWVKNTYGTDFGNHEFYERVFELILRLRGNFIWPAMWGWAFYADDPLNSKTADEMGVMVGTSHHEPMGRNHQEWARNRNIYGQWNYSTNKETLDQFFREGIERLRNTQDIVTIGMRGDGDEAMSEEADIELLQSIISNQRRIISDVTGKDASETPQVWALYKEVLDYYDKGMEVPDDVTLLLCDDNWGNVRRVPDPDKRDRKGGWGLYYHVDYVGAPRNSKLLNCTPVQNMWEQLLLAADYGMDRLWILNVGDLKPMEYPISLFMDMAWNPEAFRNADVRNHTREFFSMQFGSSEGPEAARIFNLLSQYNGRVTPELLDKDTYNLNTGEWDKVCAEYRKLETEAWRQYNGLAPEYRDAYMQLILFPLQVMTNLYEMYYAQAVNHRLYQLGDPEANYWADEVKRCFERDGKLMHWFNNELADGKWNGMMHQKHIGYTSWNDDFPADKMPDVFYIDSDHIRDGGFVFRPSDGQIIIESNHFFETNNPDIGDGVWVFTPHLGRTKGGMSVMPYTAPVDGAQLNYAFTLPEDTDSIKLHVIVKSNLAFLNPEGHRFSIRIDDGDPVEVNYNHNLNENPENIYTVFYPTVAGRVVDNELVIYVTPGATDNQHTLTLSPLDPGIVFEKIVVDLGGYEPSHLFGEESPYSIKALNQESSSR